MNPDAGSMSELPDSSEPLDPPDFPRVAAAGPPCRELEPPVLSERDCGGSAERR
jgi:hypothetical protein